MSGPGDPTAPPFRVTVPGAGDVVVVGQEFAPEAPEPFAGDPAPPIGAPARRAAELGAGRSAARAAIESLGEPGGPIPRDPDGVPVWPPGVLGSIAHSATTAVAAVARRTDRLVGLGIDTEPIGSVGPELFATVFTDGERARLAALAPALQARLATRWFCLKEAAFKAQFPGTRRFLEFEECEVAGPDHAATPVLVTVAAEARSPFTGFWVETHGHVVAVVVIAAP